VWDLRALRIDVPTWDLTPGGCLVGIHRGVRWNDFLFVTSGSGRRGEGITPMLAAV
jgi:hypothetical protein